MGGADNSSLIVPNKAVPDRTKIVTLVLFFGTDWDGTVPKLTLPGGFEAFSDVSLGSETAIWKWYIYPQPASETIKFPGMYGYDMQNHMVGMKVGTICVPEPSTLAVLGGGLLLLVTWRRRAVRG